MGAGPGPDRLGAHQGQPAAAGQVCAFSPDTAKLLRRYVDLERAAIDPGGRRLDDYLQLAGRGEVALETVPLFLSQRGTAWSVSSFRAHFWKPACAAAGLDVDIHQARHWYVTQAITEVHERGRRGQLTVERGLAELVAYMKWRSGEAVLQAYNHVYDAAHHAQIQDAIFQRLRAVAPPGPPAGTQPTSVAPLAEPEVEGRHTLYDFLVGASGYPDAFLPTE